MSGDSSPLCNWFSDYKKSITYIKNNIVTIPTCKFLVVLGADRSIDFDITARKSGSIKDVIEEYLLIIWS